MSSECNFYTVMIQRRTTWRRGLVEQRGQDFGVLVKGNLKSPLAASSAMVVGSGSFAASLRSYSMATFETRIS